LTVKDDRGPTDIEHINRKQSSEHVQPIPDGGGGSIAFSQAAL
jgi:hypothetical protein